MSANVTMSASHRRESGGRTSCVPMGALNSGDTAVEATRGRDVDRRLWLTLRLCRRLLDEAQRGDHMVAREEHGRQFVLAGLELVVRRLRGHAAVERESVEPHTA